MLAREQDLGVEKIVLISSPSHLVDVIDYFAKSLNLTESVVARMSEALSMRLGEPIDFFSVKKVVKVIKAQGLIVHDRHDNVVSFSNAEAIANNWTTATLIATENLGHRKITRNPDVIEKVISFLLT